MWRVLEQSVHLAWFMSINIDDYECNDSTFKFIDLVFSRGQLPLYPKVEEAGVDNGALVMTKRANPALKAQHEARKYPGKKCA